MSYDRRIKNIKIESNQVLIEGLISTYYTNKLLEFGYENFIKLLFLEWNNGQITFIKSKIEMIFVNLKRILDTKINSSLNTYKNIESSFYFNYYNNFKKIKKEKCYILLSNNFGKIGYFSSIIKSSNKRGSLKYSSEATYFKNYEEAYYYKYLIKNDYNNLKIEIKVKEF